MDQIWLPNLKGRWTWAQETQNNEFVESGLENWVKVGWTANTMGSKDRNRKMDWSPLKEIILGQVRGDQFLYIYLSLQVYLLIATVFLFFFFFGLLYMKVPPHYIAPSRRFWPSTCWLSRPSLECLFHRTPHCSEVFFT